MTTEAIFDEVGSFLAKGWDVGELENGDFMITSPDGSAYVVDGIHLPNDDDAPDFDKLSSERQREEVYAERVCDLVVHYRFRTNDVLTNERYAALKTGQPAANA